jgi:hypothetical protein
VRIQELIQSANLEELKETIGDKRVAVFIDLDTADLLKEDQDVSQWRLAALCIRIGLVVYRANRALLRPIVSRHAVVRGMDQGRGKKKGESCD